MNEFEAAYFKRACAFIFPDGTMVDCMDYTNEQFKRCLECKHFDTFYESYTCSNEDGKSCLLGE